MPRLSVILPVKNGKNTIESAVRSTLRSLPRDSELVVFDDSSTDATPGLLNAISDRRLRVLSSPRVSGLAPGLNHLIANTDSALVARMDADDISLPWRFRSLPRPSRGLPQVSFTTVVEWRPETKRLTPNAPVSISRTAFPFHLLLTNPVAHPTMLADREALERVGGYRSVPSEDYDLWLRMQLAGVQIRRTPVPALVYRVHASQVTASALWRRSSWEDPDTLSAFRELSEKTLGHPFPRLTTLSIAPNVGRTEFDETLERFAAAVTRASAVLTGAERWFLLRKLHTRLATVRQNYADHVAGTEPTVA